MQRLCRSVIILVSVAVVLDLGLSISRWSVTYCPPEGCLHRCSHIKNTDIGKWCGSRTVRRLLGGDVDNNGWCDIICVSAAGEFFIMYNREATGFGGSPGGSLKSSTFCRPSTGFHTVVKDINSDGYDDIICVIDDVPNDNQIRVSYIAGKRAKFAPGINETISNVTISTASYINTTNALFTDKNRFKRTAVCTKYQSQCDHVHLDSIAPMAQWYPWCAPDKGYFYSGDLNGDGFCDIICHRSNNHIYVMFYIIDIRRFLAPFESIRADGDLRQVGSWCSFTSSTVRVIDVNFDGHADIVCGGVNATEPYKIKVIYGAPYNEFIAKSSAPIDVRSSDILKPGLNDLVVSCVGCFKPVVSNGNLLFNAINKTYQVACLPGYQLRGSPLIECIEGYYSSALPICQKMEVNSQCDVFIGKSIYRKGSEHFVIPSALRPFEVASVSNIGECAWRCRSNSRCMNAEMNGNSCRLYDFEAVKNSLVVSKDGSVSILCG